jgi:hypothetical protein
MCNCTGERSFSEQLTKWKKQLRPEEIRAVEVGCADMYAQIYPDLGIGFKTTQVNSFTSHTVCIATVV